MAKILVTGGAGFIGSHLIESLLEDNEVLCIDDFNDFYDPKLKEDNLTGVIKRENFKLIIGDITDSRLVNNVFHKENPEIVIHLAARAGVRPSLEDPWLYEKVNVSGTLNLLEASGITGVKKFIFGSSSSVYGVNNKVPFKEDDTLLNPVSPYAASKIAGEAYCNTYSYIFGIPLISLRFFTVYGPRQRPDLAIRKFAELMLRGKEITLFGNGQSARDYTFIDDVIKGIKASLEYPLKGHEVFNLGNSYPIELIELVEMLEEGLGVKAKIKWEKDQLGDVPVTYADLEKSRELLGYKPEYHIKDGLQVFAKWIKQLKNG